MPLDIGRQTIGRFVTARPILLQTLHHGPVQVATQKADEFLNLAVAATRQSAAFVLS
jgi:hypothetical protein